MPNVLPIPSFYNAADVENWKRPTPYQQREKEALIWAKQHSVKPAATDTERVCLMLIDCQLTFCHPDFELYVGGQSGRGAIEDSARICEFIYRNLGTITEIDPTLDTHTAMQIFHPIFWLDEKGNHPVGGQTIITYEDVRTGKWRVNPGVSSVAISGGYMGLQRHALYYTKKLEDSGKYPLMVWPYHAMLSSLGHALVPSIEEALFFHNVARNSQTGFEIKGGNPSTENYSVLDPEVSDSPTGRVDQDGNPELTPIAQRNTRFIKKLLAYDKIIIAGQAKSHCVAWTIDDLLTEINTTNPELAKKVWLLEDCTSPVVIPGVVDFTDDANDAFKRFFNAGMHIVKSTTPIEQWR